MKTEIVRSLKQHEELIESGIKGFLDVGRSLIAIRDGKLYRDKYDTFEAYCKERWQFTDRRARQYIEAVEVVENISENGTIVHKKIDDSGQKQQNVVPVNEAQARAVADATEDPKTRNRIWQTAVATAPKAEDGTPKVTAAVVRKAAESVLGTGKPREPGEDKPEPQHVESKSDETPFDEPLAQIDWVLNVAVPKIQEHAIAAEKALGSGKGSFAASAVSKLVAPIHAAFQGIRGVVKNAQQKARRK